MGQAMLKNCPICRKKAVEKYMPFCSSRCADIDLGGWLGEKYRVQTNEGPDQPNSNEDADIE